MKKELRGFSKIFAFTFRQQTRRRGFLITLILVALLCLLIPSGAMTAAAYFGQDDASASQGGNEMSEAEAYEANLTKAMASIKEILVVNETDDGAYSAEALELSLIHI